MRVLTDFHHNSLMISHVKLFEERLKMDVYRPIGMEWFNEGWSHSRECHYTRPNGKYEVDAMTRLNSLYVIVHECGDEIIDIHIPSDRIEKQLQKEIEHAIGLAAINEKEQELENASSFDWSIGHVSHYYI